MPALSHTPGEVISYITMCQAWSASLQKGMNFRLRPDCSVILMSRRANAPYQDQIREEGRVLIYEGHDVSKTKDHSNPKSINQPRKTPGGKLTQNGLFEQAAQRTKRDESPAELVAVYEKIHSGIWAFNGFFNLTDSWEERAGERTVFKFQLELSNQSSPAGKHAGIDSELLHTRLIPSAVKLEVWQRDKGQCVLCGSAESIHFDHDLPFSKGGSSLVAANIRLLCAKHNLSKGAKIQ
jgi:hypothetical protein